LFCGIAAGEIPATTILERKRGIAFRIVFNTGQGAGPTVGHVRAHVPGGRPMAWPPG